jgi:DNA-binding transcriptional regulator YiaG
MILSQAENKQEFRSPVIAPPLKEPEEFDPIELLEMAMKKFRLKIWQFAMIFGLDQDTIYKWRSGKDKPGRLARIRAATLLKEWNLN